MFMFIRLAFPSSPAVKERKYGHHVVAKEFAVHRLDTLVHLEM